MRALPLLSVLALLAQVSACGGGADSSTGALAGGAVARRQALAAGPAGADDAPAVAADTIFAWAERQYPDLFPAGPATQGVLYEYKHFQARRYEGPGNHLGLVNGGTVYGLGRFTNGELANLGSFESYLCQASPAECAPRPARVLRVRIDAGSLQCEPGSGSSRLDMRRRLTQAGVAVVGSDCGFGSFAVPAVCGYADTRYWMFDIADADAAQAAALGFLPIDKDSYPGTPSEWACSY